MIVVTGGAGFIGSNLVSGLNHRGRDDILVVDDLTDGTKFRNLVPCRIMDYWHLDDFYDALEFGDGVTEKIDAVFHQGACSTTTEWDGHYMMDRNYTCSKLLLHYCLDNRIPFIYASSGSVYGTGTTFSEDPVNEAPVNVYGYSKYLFDNYVRRVAPDPDSQVTGLRYFNVFGPNEQHKHGMASVAWHFNRQLLEIGKVRLFRGNDGYGDGEQRRDFIHVSDVVSVNLWLLEHPEISGIFNVGTGQSRSFNEVAQAIIDWHGKGEIKYIDFPDKLKGAYQSFTEADISRLRDAGYRDDFMSLESGIGQYLDWLNKPAAEN
ncbi:MAG TPA: ADP-glyceromanno-heptose 6-epimerase [Gammaproteobacteria bacterium]|nr:ADP-glyceromanno-heptose 6-epimerase [Gammaproteobacteria bacterium]